VGAVVAIARLVGSARPAEGEAKINRGNQRYSLASLSSLFLRLVKQNLSLFIRQRRPSSG
jgi:hypothetical protein